MGKKVLVAVDMRSISEATILYGIELASRIQASVILGVIMPEPTSTKKSGAGGKSSGPIIPQGAWMDRAVEESQRHAVGLEIFVAASDFFEAIHRLIQDRPTIGFVVIDAPKTLAGKQASQFSSALNRLHKDFEGDILLVEKAGKMTPVSELYLHTTTRENSV